MMKTAHTSHKSVIALVSSLALLASPASACTRALYVAKDGTVLTGRPANMHLAISDASRDSAIFECVDGKLVLHP